MDAPQKEYSDCLQKALRYLSVRNRSEKEMSDYLAKKNFEKDTLEKTIDYMKSRLLIDDERFALEYFARARSKNYGQAKIILELKGKGISSKTIGLAAKNTGDAEYENCMAVAVKKLAVLKDASQKKLPLFLRGRGFDWNVIKRVLRDIGQSELNTKDV
ncbi:MAG: recombination regulator RecX [Leptospirales bacterium]|nr:recombination regulator RecX [Leptospirales bacterium]